MTSVDPSVTKHLPMLNICLAHQGTDGLMVMMIIVSLY